VRVFTGRGYDWSERCPRISEALAASGTASATERDPFSGSFGFRACKENASVVTLTLVSHLSQAQCGLLLPACHQGVYARLRRAMEKVGMRGRFRESDLWKRPLTGPNSGFLLCLWPSPRNPRIKSGEGEERRIARRLYQVSETAH
jgi:hypothetical protein